MRTWAETFGMVYLRGMNRAQNGTPSENLKLGPGLTSESRTMSRLRGHGLLTEEQHLQIS
jgi:hypothetical protein